MSQVEQHPAPTSCTKPQVQRAEHPEEHQGHSTQHGTLHPLNLNEHVACTVHPAQHLGHQYKHHPEQEANGGRSANSKNHTVLQSWSKWFSISATSYPFGLWFPSIRCTRIDITCPHRAANTCNEPCTPHRAFGRGGFGGLKTNVSWENIHVILQTHCF